jgi:O-antigen/teichoic acid export membrane protein
MERVFPWSNRPAMDGSVGVRCKLMNAIATAFSFVRVFFVSVMSVHARAGAVVLSGRLMLAIGQFASYAVLTRFLPPGELGRYYLLVGTADAVNALLLMALPHWYAREGLSLSRRGHLWEGLRLGLMLQVLAALFAALVLGTANQWQIFELSSAGWVMWLALPIILLGGAQSNVVSGLFNLFNKRGWAVGLAIAGFYMRVAGTLVLTLWLGGSAEMAVLGASLGAGMAGMAAVCLAYRNWGRGRKTEENYRHDWRRFWPFYVPLVLQGVLYWLQTQGFRYVLAARVEPEAVGLFTAAFSAGAMPLLMFDTVFIQFYIPYLMAAVQTTDQTDKTDSKRKQGEALSRLFRDHLSLLLPMAVMALIGAPSLVRLVAGDKYAAVAEMARWGTLTETVRLISTTAFWTALVAKRTGAMTPAVALSAGLSLGATYILAPLAPLNGTGVARLLAACASSAYLLFMMIRIMNVKFPWSEVSKVLILSILGGAVICSMSFIWPEPTAIYDAGVLFFCGIMGLLVWIKPLRLMVAGLIQPEALHAHSETLKN